MNQRTYNKIYVNKNRAEGSKNLFLGYKYDEKEIVFKKDAETYFHVPIYSEPIKLTDTNLIANGAAGGPFPAASDRIFKSQKNYGNFTPHGQPSTTSDGLWFCSWLHYDPNTNSFQWLDRFYDPGKFDYNQANEELNLPPTYKKNFTNFYDLPTKFVFEAGILYKYFHCGESTYQQLLQTAQGANKQFLQLGLTNWLEAPSAIDTSANQIFVNISTNAESRDFVVSTNEVVDKVLPTTINFDNNYETHVSLNFGPEYLFDPNTNEFSWSLWVKSAQWEKNFDSQLIGNRSTKGGGISISLTNYQATPITIIPETKYGHILFVNEKGNGFLDKSLQDNLLPVSIACAVVDGDNNVVVCQSNSSGLIYKLDHTGDILASTKNYFDEQSLFSFTHSDEIPKQMLCGNNNEICILTTRGYYIFDSSLKIIQNSNRQFNNSIAAFSYISNASRAQLEVIDEVYDAKFIEKDLYSLKLEDGNLYKNNNLVAEFGNVATNFAISPDNKLWVLHGTNQCTIIDVETQTKLVTIDIGAPAVGFNQIRKKYISFINQYDRKTDSRQWFCVLYYSDEKILYYLNSSGVITNNVPINGLFNRNIISNYQQNPTEFQFDAVSDFTGYEHKRVFSKLSPYNNKTRIELAVSLNDLSKPFKSFKKFSVIGSIENWANDSWQHLLLTYKGKTFDLYNNAKSLCKLIVPGNFENDFSNQPSFTIGSSTGNQNGFNDEVRHCSNIFNGRIGDVQVFSYCLPMEFLNFFLKSVLISENLIWHQPSPNIQYVEEIEKMYKHKIPGAKSQFFNVKLIGSKITDLAVRSLIETDIRSLIESSKPAHTELLKIEWID